MSRHLFAFTRAHRLAAVPFGVSPSTAWVEVGDDLVRVRFGPWRLETDRVNVAGVERTGGYSFVKTAGPAHLSLADRGITFATNGDAGVCLRFVEPVAVRFPVGRLRCPAATVTVVDPDRLRAELERGPQAPSL